MPSQRYVHTYAGKDLDATWDARLCIHVGECTRAHGELFKSGRDPWGEPDRADADTVAEVVTRCPTGALAYVRKDGGPAETPNAENTAVIANNGPIYVRGDLGIPGIPADMPATSFRAALCRCGESKNKPFCDNSHESTGFVDRGAVGRTGSPLEAIGGPLVIRPLPNGPLLVSGNLTIVSGLGRRAWQGTKTSLCRCGRSSDKPFCDSTHTKVGFVAD
ncbi:MAG: CDGSH iron-sulfur domain-containing protein [Actinobacteria bacterium]|nr:CDGSH iron-sulfur domain-containing protein [Actinomycetota bacterium]